MSDMEQGHIQDSLAAYALGILDAEELEYLNQHLATCEFCQTELVAYESVVDALPLAAPDASPSPTLKNRLMSQVKPDLVVAPSTDVSVTHLSAGQSLWKELAATFQSFVSGPIWRPVTLVIIIALLAGNVVLWQELNQPDPNGWRRVNLSGTENAPEASGIIYISADGKNGTIIVDHLPQLEVDRQFQLWLIRDGQRSSGAVFSVDDDGYRGLQIESSQPLQDFDAFGITIEPAGGSPGPTGVKVLGYNPES